MQQLPSITYLPQGQQTKHLRRMLNDKVQFNITCNALFRGNSDTFPSDHYAAADDYNMPGPGRVT